MNIYYTQSGKFLGYLQGSGHFKTDEMVLSFPVAPDEMGRVVPVLENGNVVGIVLNGLVSLTLSKPSIIADGVDQVKVTATLPATTGEVLSFYDDEETLVDEVQEVNGVATLDISTLSTSDIIIEVRSLHNGTNRVVIEVTR